MSIYCNATQQGLERTSGLPNGNLAYTMMGWFRRVSAAASYQCVLNIDSGNGSGDTYYLRSSGTNLAAIWVNNANGVQSSSSYDENFWHHYALVRESNTRVLGYIDGVLEIVGPTTDVSGRAATSRMDIGQAKGAGGFGEDLQSGVFENVRVWNRALTRHEIIREMRSLAPANRQGLVTYLPCKSTDIGEDLAGFGRWTVSGSPLTGEPRMQYIPQPASKRSRPLYLASSTSYTLTAAQGSYSLNGQAAALTAARKMAAAQGSYALNGQAAALRVARILAAAQGSYALSGQAAALRATRILAAAQGAYALNGQTVGLVRGPAPLLATQGSYALTGQAAALRAAFRPLAAQGSYALNGQSAGLIYSAAPPAVGNDWLIRMRRRRRG